MGSRLPRVRSLASVTHVVAVADPIPSGVPRTEQDWGRSSGRATRRPFATRLEWRNRVNTARRWIAGPDGSGSVRPNAMRPNLAPGVAATFRAAGLLLAAWVVAAPACGQETKADTATPQSTGE